MHTAPTTLPTSRRTARRGHLIVAAAVALSVAASACGTGGEGAGSPSGGSASAAPAASTAHQTADDAPSTVPDSSSVETTIDTTPEPTVEAPAADAPIDPVSTDPASTSDAGVASQAAAPPAGAPTPDPVPAAEQEPIDEIDESEPVGEPTITQQGASTQPPAAPEMPAPAIDRTPIALTILAGQATEDPTIAPTPPAPVNVPPYGALGDLTSNAVGCASNCIVSALLTKQDVQAELGFEIVTNVDAQIHVWIDDREPWIIGGVPVFPGLAPTAMSPGFGTTWATTLSSLLHDTTYHVIVRATDLYGNQRYATTPITTISTPGPDQLTGAGGGCYYQCITGGHVIPGESYDTVELVVLTSNYADFHVAISSQEPGWIGSAPLLPQDESFVIDQHGETGIRGTASGLEGDTVYNVAITATDLDGFTSHALGQFRTAPLPPRVPSPTDVVIFFESVHIEYDGDSSAGNRGEISLRWGLPDFEYRGSRSEDKLGDGDVVDLPSDTAGWVSVEAGGLLPRVAVNAVERDGIHNCASGYGLFTQDFYDEECRESLSVALLEQQPLEWLDTLGSCAAFGFSGDAAGDRCVLLETESRGGDFVSFWVVVRFHVV